MFPANSLLPVFEFESWFRMATCCLWAVSVFYLCLSLSHGFIWPHVPCEEWVCILPVFEFESWFRIATCRLWAVFYLCLSLSHGCSLWSVSVCFTCVWVWVIVSYCHMSPVNSLLPVFEFESWFRMATCCLWAASVCFTCVWVWVMVSSGHMFPVNSECVFYLCLSLSHSFISPHVPCEQSFTCVWVWVMVLLDHMLPVSSECILPVFEFESWFHLATCSLWGVSVCFTCVWVWVMVLYCHMSLVSSLLPVFKFESWLFPVISECVFYLCLSLSHCFILPHVTCEQSFTCVWV